MHVCGSVFLCSLVCNKYREYGGREVVAGTVQYMMMIDVDLHAEE